MTKKLGKHLGDDFREGKMTAPVLIALEESSASEREFWTNAMTHRRKDDKDLARAKELIARHRGIERSLEMAQGYGQKATQALASLKHSELREVLNDLVGYSIHRGS
jgi:octaprenyl-diphosphate synthase